MKTSRHGKNSFTYSVDFLGEKLVFTFCRNCFGKIDFENNRHILRGLILNRKKPGLNTQVIHWDSNLVREEGGLYLKDELEKAIYPRTPKDKLDNLLIEIYKRHKYDGETLQFNNVFWNYAYFKNEDECSFFLDTLDHLGLITTSGSTADDLNVRITFAGITEYLRLTEEGFGSNKCFVAMSFDPSIPGIREAIRNALKKTGFDPVIIDETNIASDETLVDAIIANIRKCKFCIADFSYHKNGVYFESGFAVGQGKQVIYTCEKEEFKKAHFDVKSLQHIIYNTPAELEKGLADKIEAWIK